MTKPVYVDRSSALNFIGRVMNGHRSESRTSPSAAGFVKNSSNYQRAASYIAMESPQTSPFRLTFTSHFFTLEGDDPRLEYIPVSNQLLPRENVIFMNYRSNNEYKH